MKNIKNQLTNYFFARDITQAHTRYEFKVREAILDEVQLHYLLDNHKPIKVIDVLGSSVIPNILSGVGIGFSIYNNDLSFAVITGLVGEAFRLSLRRNAIKRLDLYSRLMDFKIKIEDSAQGACDEIQEISDKLDNEGEEWKGQ